jgi:hypothetical protein
MVLLVFLNGWDLSPWSGNMIVRLNIDMSGALHIVNHQGKNNYYDCLSCYGT